MPLLLIVVLVVVAIALVAAVATPLIVGDPIAPTPETPTEISAPAEPGQVDVEFDPTVNNFTTTPVEDYDPSTVRDVNEGYEDSGFDDVDGYEPTPTNVDRAVEGAANSIPDF